jgi:hypothetical protein
MLSCDTTTFQCRDQILYGLSRDDFAHILTTFPLVFPDTDAGQAKRAALLATYDAWAGQFG